MKSTVIMTLGLGALFAVSSQAATIQISFTNLAPRGGTWIMRPWVGFHDGNYQTFTVGQPALEGVRHIAEDGLVGDANNTLPPPDGCPYAGGTCQFQSFPQYPNHGPEASIGNPTAPGQTISRTFSVDSTDPKNRFLSYLVMIVPSNDAFFGTDSAHPLQLFDSSGNFLGPRSITVFGSDILDAGTEANTESQSDTAFFGQTVAGTGTHPDPAGSTIHKHPGYIPNGPILTGSTTFLGTTYTFQNANFTQAGYQIAQVNISLVQAVPEPATFATLGLGAFALLCFRKFQRKRTA